MIVQCGTIDEFLEELAAEAEEHRVWRSVVRLRIERVPEQEEQVSFQVAFMATALIGGDRPEQLLSFDGWAGKDGSRGDHGTQTAEHWQGQVRRLCEGLGLKLRRGRYQI